MIVLDCCKIVLQLGNIHFICMYRYCIVVVLLWINVNLYQNSRIMINGTTEKQNRVYKLAQITFTSRVSKNILEYHLIY